ncbi:LysR family transcriptional regulator [Phenylobacterium sp.]|uniref:LysR family transcriptional regulator n=1 Tax=Phenylobacterium sp. TaxID=1871053 RepID=UPI00122182A3|nr:LysR family transcriptional regulator [Phenylobacterium sp.]THD64315.1 MAG: LysR family transcriptional regulator [Phenylobacterium sp.]
MDRLDALRLFVRVVESGSFSAAAREAGVGQSAVSKQIAALEARLGAQLVRRTSRSMSLTDAGQGFYESAVRLVDEFEAAESLIGRGQSAPSGLVRVTTAPVFGRLYVVPRLPAFFARYPDISIELSASERAVNLIEEGVDLAIRHGVLADSALIVRKLANAPFATVASPAYLAARGVPATPTELQGHACLIFAPHREVRPWEFRDGAGVVLHHPAANFRTGDAEQIRAAVLAGLGLSHGPIWLFAPEIASGEVRVVLGAYAPGPLAVSAVHPAGRRLPTKLRVLIDFLAEAFAGAPGLAAA